MSGAYGAVAALFPGQNSQVVGMGRDFYEHSPAARRVLDEAEAAMPGLLATMWEGPEETLKLTANQQPALVAAAAAAYAAYREAGGEEPRVAAGHSLGEYSALVAAGALALRDAVALVHKRGSYMQRAVAEGVGAMAAVLKLGVEAVERACEAVRSGGGVVEVANLNAPEQTVISGEAAAVAQAGEQLAAQGGRVIALKVSAPFHCSLMKPAGEALAEDLRGVAFTTPRFDVVANVTAEVVAGGDLPALLERQVTAPVRWVESVERLDALGATRFLEFGSGRVLTGLVGRILEKPSCAAIVDMASLEAALAVSG